MENIIQIENVYREFKVLKQKKGLRGSISNLIFRDYETVKAVNGLNLKIKKGEVVGFIGSNGAGKSTTIKMMIGVLRPNRGDIRINNLNPYDDHEVFTNDIGVVFGQRTQLWWALPVRDSYNILKQIYEVSDVDFDNNMKLFEDIVGINKLIDKPVRELSLGQRTLCDILAAFLHNPSIVFLDEPTIGLDVSMKYKIHALIKELNRQKNTTVILTSHDMSDVRELCNRVVIMNKGVSIYDNSIDELVKFFGNYKRICMRFYEKKVKESSEKIFRCFSDAHFQVKIIENGAELLVDENKISVMKVLSIIEQNLKVQDINVSNITIEEIVRKIYENE